SGVGGKPVRSKLARRINSRLPAGPAGFKFCCSSFARMKRSIAVRAQAASRTLGGVGLLTGRNDQCSRALTQSIAGSAPAAGRATKKERSNTRGSIGRLQVGTSSLPQAVADGDALIVPMSVLRVRDTPLKLEEPTPVAAENASCPNPYFSDKLSDDCW